MEKYFKCILVPVDGSEEGNRAAAYGANLARMTGMPVTLLYAYHPDPNRVMGMVGLSAGTNYTSIKKYWLKLRKNK